MMVLLLTEHYKPKVGGTVSYVSKTASNLAKMGLEVFLLVPSSGEIGSVKTEQLEANLKLIRIGVTNEDSIKHTSEERTNLCHWVKENIVELSLKIKVQNVHLLYGLFLADILPTEKLKENGIKTFHTIHNIPPLECATSWREDKRSLFYKDLLRKQVVKVINKKRILRNKFDIYITPSELVKEELSTYIPKPKIKVISHGGAEEIKSESREKKTGRNLLLTVGGIVPHKSQHEIPAMAKYLKKKGIDFKWYIVGPVRNERYSNYIKREISRLKLDDCVMIKSNVGNEELAQLYRSAQLYIHLSKEEGFCITVLDAISYGVPTLARPTGAIPEMLNEVGGNLLDLNPKYVAKVLEHYIKIADSLEIRETLLNQFKSKYTWKNAAKNLLDYYKADASNRISE